MSVSNCAPRCGAFFLLRKTAFPDFTALGRIRTPASARSPSSMITPDQRRQMDEPAQREITERQPPLPPDASPVAMPTPTRRWNFIVRHWRGDLPLWVSFWIVTVLGSLPVCVPIFVAGTMLGYD